MDTGESDPTLSSVSHWDPGLAARGASESRRSEETSDLAKLASGFDIFVSHSWRASRWQKFVALALYFHLRLAAFATGAVRQGIRI